LRGIAASPFAAARRSSGDGLVDRQRKPVLTSREHDPESLPSASQLSFSLR
jgi:hypothetical protein